MAYGSVSWLVSLLDDVDDDDDDDANRGDDLNILHIYIDAKERETETERDEIILTYRSNLLFTTYRVTNIML